MMLALSKWIPVPMFSRYTAEDQKWSCFWIHWRGCPLFVRRWVRG